MPKYRYRELHPLPEAENVYTRWLAHLDDIFTRRQDPVRRAETVRDELHQLYLGRAHGGKLNINLNTELPFNVLELSLHPDNATLEPEYYGDRDDEKYALRKPLIWFWQMFDRSPVGLNHWLGFRFRCMLGKHIFRHMGRGVKIFQDVEFSYGYNLTIEDNCVVHRGCMLDDRGEIILHAGTSLSDYASVFSHRHDPNDQADVTNMVTEIGPRARITYRAAVMSGVKIGADAILGAHAVATKEIPDRAIFGGVPAKQLKSKDDIQKPTDSPAEAATPPR